MGHENKHSFTTKTVLCVAPYCLASLYYIHTQDKKGYLLNLTQLQWLKELAEVLHVGHVHTTSAVQFKVTVVLCNLAKFRNALYDTAHVPMNFQILCIVYYLPTWYGAW